MIRELLDRGHTLGNHTYRHDNFIMLHDTPPRGRNTGEDWLREVDRLRSGIGERGLRILQLPELIDRPVMSGHEIIAPKQYENSNDQNPKKPDPPEFL